MMLLHSVHDRLRKQRRIVRTPMAGLFAAAVVLATINSNTVTRAMAAPAAGPSSTVELLHRLEPTDLTKVTAKDAVLFLDPTTHALTITFRYVPGEPEVRIPVASMRWPTNWKAF